MTLGERIVKIRKELGLSQKELAERLEISATRLNYWEKNKRFPPIPMLNKLSEALGVDGDFLLGRTESIPPSFNSTWIDAFNDMRRQSGMSLDELSEKSGVPKETIVKIASDITKSPPLDIMRRLLCVLGYTVKDLNNGIQKNTPFAPHEQSIIQKYRTLDRYGKDAVNSILDCEYQRCVEQSTCIITQPTPIERVLTLPHSELKASAGTGFWLDDEAMHPWTVSWNEQTRKADFCLDVQGDSMEPMFQDGDIILVRIQPSVEIGEIGLYILDGNGYVKRQGKRCLESLNPQYEDIIPDEFSVIECKGLVIGQLHPEWIIEK